MPHFSADMLSPLSAAHPTVRLNFEGDRPSERPFRIYLTWSRRVSESHVNRMPIYYRFMPPMTQHVRFGQYRLITSNSSSPSRLILIVGPGVSVRLSTFRRLFQENNNLILDVYRIQDPSLVPTIGRRFNIEYFLRKFRIDVSPPSGFQTGTLTSAGLGEDYFDSRIASENEYENYFNSFPRSLHRPMITITDPVGDLHNGILEALDRQTVRSAASRGTRVLVLETASVFEFSEQNNGLIIEHPYSGQRLIIHCPALHWNETAPRERQDHEARFCWDIEANDQGITQIRVLKTSVVRVTLELNFEMVGTNESNQQFHERISMPVFVVKDANFNVIPLQGNTLPWNRGRTATQTNVVLPASVSWLQGIADVAVGFIPGVGDAVDLAEFIYAIRTNEDRWGHEVSTFEKVLMGAGAVLSLVGPSIASVRHLGDIVTSARRTRALRQRLQTMEQPFNRMLGRLQSAQLSQSDRLFVQQMSDRIKRGARLSRTQMERAINIMKRFPECPV